ncbi:UNVERIFIED_ORG: hypothetical protein FHU00_3925 [Citrobacter freundii]
MARLAAFDMDGTLLMPNHHLGDETLSTLAVTSRFFLDYLAPNSGRFQRAQKVQN